MSDSESKVKVDLKSCPVLVDDIIDLNSPTHDDVEEGTPLRPIFCLKNRDELKEIEDKEDCFILDFDPDEYDPLIISKLSVSKNADSPDISVVAEKGQVACRDFPHSRHSCAKYPFSTTEHESYCQLCYCFVCDIAAPCKNWNGSNGHCHAINNESWKSQRKAMQKLRNAVK